MAVPKKRTSKARRMLERQIGKEKDTKQHRSLYLS
jgi:ribosomal protein L32